VHLTSDISLLLIEICQFVEFLHNLLHLYSSAVSQPNSNHPSPSAAEEHQALGLIVFLISGSCYLLSIGYQSIDHISLKHDAQQPPTPHRNDSKERPPLKRKLESFYPQDNSPSLHLPHPPLQSQTITTPQTHPRRDELLIASNAILSAPLMHSLSEILSLAHSNPNHIKREHKQVTLSLPGLFNFSFLFGHIPSTRV
jgi:hypothetical protein